jgi:Leucine-rich repeat (LRR) protein
MSIFRYFLLLILCSFQLVSNAQNINDISDRINRADTRFLNALPVPSITSLTAIHLTPQFMGIFNEKYLWKMLNVQHAKLEYNNEQQLREMLTILAKLPALKSLEFQENVFRNDTLIAKFELPDEIRALKNIEWIRFRGNSRLNFEKSLPKIGQLTKLKKLFFELYNVNSLPIEIKELKNLDGLGLLNNKIKSLPEWLAGMQNLKEISISGSQLDMDASLKQLSKLKELEVLVFDYQGFPENLDASIKFDKLKAFYIRSGTIKNADVFFDFLSTNSSLETLRLVGTSIKNIPESIGNFKTIKRTYHQQCKKSNTYS